MLTMYDSTTLDAVPADAQAVAGYTSGFWPTYAEVVRRWPNAKHVSIAVTAGHDADCLDVESGDATNDQAAPWVKRQLANGAVRPIVYTSVANASPLLGLLARSGVARSAIRLWTAHYGSGRGAHLCDSACGFGLGMWGQADATQYDDRALGRNLDASLVSDTFFATLTIAGTPAGDATVPVAQVIATFSINEPVVCTLGCPTGGAWLATGSGHVYAVGGAPAIGMPGGNAYFAGRTLARLESYGRGFTAVATSGERYNYIAP